MKNLINTLYIVFAICVLAILNVSCSKETYVEDVFTNVETEAEVNALLEKKWVVYQFSFTEDCTRKKRKFYQLSNIQVELKDGYFFSKDLYSLKEKKGSYHLDGEELVAITDDDEVVRYYILELSEKMMKIEVVNKKDIEIMELVVLNN